MKSGKTFGQETSPEEDDIEQIFELSRLEEKANRADFKPTLDRLKLKAGETPVTRRPRFFSLPRLVMAGMATVIAVLAIGLVTITLLTPKEVTPTAIANQPVQTAVSPTPLPTSTATITTVPATVAQPSNPKNTSEAGTATPVATTQPAPATNTPPGQSSPTSNSNGSVDRVTDVPPTNAEATIPTPSDAVPTKLAIQTPIGAVVNTPSGQPGSPVTIFGTLLSQSGTGNNTVLNVRTTEGVVVVKVTSDTNFGNPDTVKPVDINTLPSGTTLSATGPLNAQGQLEATNLTINPQDRPPLVTPGYPDDTK